MGYALTAPLLLSLIHLLQNREIKIETRGVQVTVPIGQIINEATEPFITPISLILTLFITTKTLDLTEKLMKDILGIEASSPLIFLLYLDPNI